MVLAPATSVVIPIPVATGIELPIMFSRNSNEGQEYPEDYASKNTNNYGSKFKSEGEARALAREKLGKNPVNLGDNKLRSQNGVWQYRAKEVDLGGHGGKSDPHIHLEKLDPSTGEVLENWHFYWGS